MRMVFADTLIELAKQDERICLITPDMGYGILDKFQQTFPKRYFNLGITEQNCMSTASGMALAGLKPYVYSIIPFVVHRCFEQIRVDVSYMNVDVKIIGVGSGFEYGVAGATHHGTEDISMMRALPNMEIYAPGDNYEMVEIENLTAKNNRPTYIRIGRHNHPNMNISNIELGKASVIEEGTDSIAFIATGNMLPVAYDCAQELKKDGTYPMVISMHTIKPIDRECIEKLIDKNYKIYTLEEHTIIGGLGSAVAEIIAEYGKAVEFKRIGINDTYSHVVGSAQYIREQFKLDTKGVLYEKGLAKTAQWTKELKKEKMEVCL